MEGTLLNLQPVFAVNLGARFQNLLVPTTPPPLILELESHTTHYTWLLCARQRAPDPSACRVSSLLTPTSASENVNTPKKDGETSHAHGTLILWIHYQKQSPNSVQYLSKFQCYFFCRNRRKKFKVIWKHKRSQVDKRIFREKKRTNWSWSVACFRDYGAVVTKQRGAAWK